jgi:hypothetical protein
MATKMTTAAIAAVLTLSVIHEVALARAEHPHHRKELQPNAGALAETFGSVKAPFRSRSEFTVVSPQGRILGADPDQAIRFQITRDNGAAYIGK